MDFETLAARALNASRTIHKPTYAGLRILLDGLGKNQEALKLFLARRCLSRDAWRYISFEIVKDAAKGKPPSYRNCITGSPLTTLAEAYVLQLMAGQPAFSVPSCAYSYSWPTEEMAGRNFDYFSIGYERRNHNVRTLLSSMPDHVAVVADIKSFYPSVSRERLRAVVSSRIAQINDRKVSRPIHQFIEAFLTVHVPKAGIPIGPDLSHALGHLALESVDRVLMTKYGERYLRYVDDMIIVCPKEAAAGAVADIRDALACEGLLQNESKQDEVEKTVWDRECVSFAAKTEPNSFESLLEDIIIFLIFSPSSSTSLQKALRDEGFSLPVSRLRSLARSKRYRAHLHRRLSGVHGMWAWLKSWFTTEAFLIQNARLVRDRLLAEADRLAQDQPPSTPMRRRWYGQKRRYVLNRLLYLISPQDLPRLLKVTPDIDEFMESRIVMQALQSGDATAILKYPGRVISTFCQLWPEHHGEMPPTISWPKTGDRADAESATHLALYLSVAPPASYLRTLEGQFPGYRILIDVCATGKPDRSKIERLSFLDELDLLYSTLEHEKVVGLISSRFDELEDVGLEGLELGGGGYFFSSHHPYMV